ncbi:hypothetical protein Tco_1147707 [Tanacetum coccineum]
MIGVLTYFLRFQIKQSERGISINKERYVKDQLRKYDKVGSLVNTPIVPPNMLGPDLNGKVVKESQYKGMIRSLMNLTASRPVIQFSTGLYARHQVNIRNPTLLLLREFLAMFSTEAEDIATAGCRANILLIKSQLTDYGIIYEKGNLNFISFPLNIKLLDKPSFKRLIDELEPFIRSPNMYKEYLAEFWYSAKALENSKVSFYVPTGGIYGEVGVNTFRNAIGAHYLPHSREYVAPPSIDIVRPWFETIGYGETVLITNKDAIILYSLENGINIDYVSIFWEDIIIKLNKRHMEKFVPYTRFLSLLMMHKMKEGYGDAEPVVFKTPKPSFNAERVPQGTKPGAKPGHKKHSTSSKQPFVSSKEATKGGSSKALIGSKTGHLKRKKESSSAMDSNPSQTSASTPVVAEMHKEDQQTTGGPTSLRVKEDEASRTIKLEDLAKLESSVQTSFKYLDSPEDDPIIVVDDSDEDEEADEVHATTNVETEDTLVPKSSSPRLSNLGVLGVSFAESHA